jgi:hypothetical protein
VVGCVFGGYCLGTVRRWSLNKWICKLLLGLFGLCCVCLDWVSEGVDGWKWDGNGIYLSIFSVAAFTSRQPLRRERSEHVPAQMHRRVYIM